MATLLLWCPICNLKRDFIFCHVRRYSRDELVDKVRRAGFDVFDVAVVTLFVSSLLPLMMVSCFLKKGRTPIDPLEEFKLEKPANGLLGAIMGIERLIIQAGGSLLLVGRKAGDETQ